jgi:hypothetical protein
MEKSVRARTRRVAAVGLSVAAGSLAGGCGTPAHPAAGPTPVRHTPVPAHHIVHRPAATHGHHQNRPGREHHSLHELKPKPGKIYFGVTAGESIKDYQTFEHLLHRHAPVWDRFLGWGSRDVHGLSRKIARELRQAEANDFALMLSISPGSCNPDEFLSPAAVARGKADNFLLALSASIAESGQAVYIRPYGEMNQPNNAYAAYNTNGTWRGRKNSPEEMKQAWRRIAIIMRGGSKKKVNRELHALGLPGVKTDLKVLPRAKVALVWTPQVAGKPDIASNSAMAYWPGSKWVDWVGTDFFSGFPNFHGLDRFYAEVKRFHKPFVFAESGIYHGGDDPAFMKEFFRWIESHPQVRMVLYNQGNHRHGSMRLQHYPRSAHVVRHELKERRFQDHLTGR